MSCSIYKSSDIEQLKPIEEKYCIGKFIAKIRTKGKRQMIKMITVVVLHCSSLSHEPEDKNRGWGYTR